MTVREAKEICTDSSLLSFTYLQQILDAGIPQPMSLNGRNDVELEAVEIDGKPLDPDAYEKTPSMLTLKSCPDEEFELKIVTKLKPQENTLLEGLYKSSGNFCTQVASLLTVDMLCNPRSAAYMYLKVLCYHVLAFHTPNFT